MKIQVLQENLHHALQRVQRIVPTKPSLPILSTILLSAHDSVLELAGTDLYLGVRTQLPATVSDTGSIAVPGKTFSEVIALLSPGQLTLELKENTIIITAADGTTKLQCQSAEEFPSFPVADEGSISFPTKTIEQILQSIIFAVSSDTSRPVLTALLWEFAAESVGVVATDGFRLAFNRFGGITTSQLGEQAVQWLVPARALQEVARIMSQQTPETIECRYSLEKKQLVFQVGETQIYVRLLDGTYPPYQKIVPSMFALEVFVDPQTLLQHIKRAQIFARDASNIIHFEFIDQELHISATSPTAGTHQSHFGVDVAKAGQGKIAFNIKYVTDMLTAAGDQRLWFGMSESLKPAMFRLEGEPDYGYVVMPFRVTE